MNDNLAADVLLMTAAFAAGYYLHSRRKTRTSTVDETACDSDHAATEQQRPVDTITIRCEHLGHMPGHVPTAVVERASLSRDVRNLQRLGWGGNDHTNLCHYHNPGARTDLDILHVLCGSPGCEERVAIAGGNANSGFGKLRNIGWTNVTSHREQRCPYCSGRPRPRW